MARSFFLNKREGKLAGVCAGIADYFGWDVTVVRIATAVGTVALWGGLAVVYVLTALLAKPQPYS